MMRRRTILIGGGLGALALGGAGWLRTRAAADMSAHAAGLRQPLPAAASTRDLIRYATLAANGHNTQPWLFRPDARGIDILPDLTRRTPVVDPDDHHLFASLGCAAENLALAAGARGQAGQIRFDANDGGKLRVDLGPASAEDTTLFEAIPYRQSTRSDYDGSKVSAADLSRLATASAVRGVDLVLMTERAQIDRLRDLVIAGNTAQMADPAFMAGLPGRRPDIVMRFGRAPAMALSARRPVDQVMD